MSLWKLLLVEIFGILPKSSRDHVKFLAAPSTVTIEIDQSLDQDLFLQTREGIHVEDDFNRFFGGAPPVPVPDRLEISRYRLNRHSYDADIRKELPEDHVFEAFEFRKMLASQLQRQWEGASGMFQGRERFHVRTSVGLVFVVQVCWCYLGQRNYRSEYGWSVYFPSDEYGVDARNSVWSRN